MKAPISWLKKYIDVALSPEKLGERLTEVGLGTEKIIKEKNDTILELEITPNRPDWLSMLGVAREIAAIEEKKIKYPKLITDLKPKKGAVLPLTIHPNFITTPRLTGIIINNVSVKESPKWLKDRLESIGQKPINNIVDITNFVMWELGNPIHSFDYNKIEGHEMWVKQAKGGEEFESVDDITYHLPKGAIIYEDTKKIFDLVGIKGGKNSGTYEDTKIVFIVVEVDNSVLIRKASQALALRSDASAIFERGVNKGGTIDALKRTVDLILATAGGEIASELIDLKEEDFKPWKLSLRLSRLEWILGIKIPDKEVVKILDSLGLEPVLKNEVVNCIIPAYRNDLQIEEDLIEEVARIYGYNNFPKTMPQGQVPATQIPYFKDYRLDEKIKNIFVASGFSEVYTCSLVSEQDLEQNSEKVLRVDNPVSRDFEYLRPTLIPNIRKSYQQNRALFPKVSFFELGKVYVGPTAQGAREEYHLTAISNEKSYYEIKGIAEYLHKSLGLELDKNFEIFPPSQDNEVILDINITNLLEEKREVKAFKSIGKYPPITEDISFVFSKTVMTGIVIEEIKKQSTLITEVSLLDIYENSRTFHIVYQSKERNLTTQDAAEIHKKIVEMVEKKFEGKEK